MGNMAWVKLDNAFPTHQKVIEAGQQAAWLYVCALCYAASHLTDGFVSRSVLRSFPTVSRPLLYANKLVSVGLWEELSDGSGWTIHDYMKHQTTREQVERSRSLASERVRKHRGNADVTPLRNADVTPLEEKRIEEKRIVRRRSAPPSELQISPEMRAWAKSKGLEKLDLDRETQKMLDHHRAKGSTMLDWIAAWRTWMTRAGEYQPGLVTIEGKPKAAEGARIPPPIATCGECDAGWVVNDEGEAIRCPCQRAS